MTISLNCSYHLQQLNLQKRQHQFQSQFTLFQSLTNLPLSQVHQKKESKSGPRFRIHTLANFWNGSFQSCTRRYKTNAKLHDSRTQGLEGTSPKKWTRRPLTTNTEGSEKTARSSKASSITQEILDGTVSTTTNLNITKTAMGQYQKIQHYDIRLEIAKNKDLANLVTIITFDIETTGLSRENDRIVEIGVQDLRGGKDSTFETLVNPERYVGNADVHQITSCMVNRPDVPRMKDLIPILLRYVGSRQKPGGYVLLVAHNARNFDVPFLINEFNRCSVHIPPNWLFLDTLPLAREAMKSEGLKLKTNLQVLREHYEIPLVGPAHRAMSDVKCLSLILQRLTYDLKLSLSDLIGRSFTASDLISQKKKKSSG
ncbi:DNA polymerase III polC-type [Morus notabilis]|uniref:DNA polymerase III polC-type n=1 Tax=Morus notabilis TaxID=981085 RepID=W9RUU5_9ROSA|nr:DNA polymerase III polC-type [Morus notabilis]